MKRSTPLWLLLLCVGLGLLIRHLGRHEETVAARRERSARVLRLAGEDTTELTITSGGRRIECVNRDGAWFLQYPLRARADAGEIDRILSILELLPRKEVIELAERRARELKLSDYGLEPPRARITVRDNSGERELLIGADAPLGGSVYVKTADADAVVATDRDVLDALPESVEVLRDRLVLRGGAARVSRLEIWRPESLIQLAQTAGDWQIQQPVSAWADRGRVLQILDRLYALRAEKFVWDPPLAPAAEEEGHAPAAGPGVRAETYGLASDVAAARVQIWTVGDPIGHELILGKPADEQGRTVYAKLRLGESVYAVNRAILDALSVSVNDLRDRGVFRLEPSRVGYVQFRQGDRRLTLERQTNGLWMVTDPVQWKADYQTVEDMVAGLTRLRTAAFVEGSVTNLAAAGLQPPAWSVQVLPERPPEPAAVEPLSGAAAAGRRPPEPKLLLVASAAGAGPTVRAKLDEGDTVFDLPAPALPDTGGDMTDPLFYLDRTMLTVAPDRVRRITLARGGAEQTVARLEAGTWAAVNPPTNDVNRAAVEDVLFLAANLRAARVEARNPRSLAGYGLECPQTVLTLVMSGGDGIQKSVFLGLAAGADGHYAIVQGQDVVFVLPRGTVQRLSGDLVKPLALEPAGRGKGNEDPAPAVRTAS